MRLYSENIHSHRPTCEIFHKPVRSDSYGSMHTHFCAFFFCSAHFRLGDIDQYVIYIKKSRFRYEKLSIADGQCTTSPQGHQGRPRVHCAAMHFSTSIFCIECISVTCLGIVFEYCCLSFWVLRLFFLMIEFEAVHFLAFMHYRFQVLLI